MLSRTISTIKDLSGEPVVKKKGARAVEVIGIVVVAVAILINGLVAKVEDESPGGFGNSDESWRNALLKPKAHQVLIWLAGALVVGWLVYLSITK